ncbi:MAG: hypothetical protein ABJN65_12905 [Parasphingorhabdus sp.]
MLSVFLLVADPIATYTEDKHDCSAELVQDNELRLTAEDIESAQMGFNDQTAQPVINIQFSERGNKRFVKVQQGRIGLPIALCFNEELLTKPILREPVWGGQVQISGGFTVEEATALATSLNGRDQN